MGFVWQLIFASGVPAREPLACGAVEGRFLASGETQSFDFFAAAGTAFLVQASALSGDVSPIRLRASGPGVDEWTCEQEGCDTCTGVLEFVGRGASVEIEVSACFEGGGRYALTLSVISDSPEHCGRFLECGTTPDGIGLGQAGEVDSYIFPGEQDTEVTLGLSALDGVESAFRLRIFDPVGRRLPAPECASSATMRLPATGMYTVLVSACGPPREGLYRLSRHDATCRDGPEITYFGFVRADGRIEIPGPDDFDAAGRPIYRRSRGTLVVEARPGADRRPVDETTFETGPPALQVIVSRDLGNGNPAVCDFDADPEDGVPATEPFLFSNTAPAINRYNDLGCRFDDGQGRPLGRASPVEACTKRPDGVDDFVDITTTMQFCAAIGTVEGFQPGDTLVAARVRNWAGVFGAPRQILVRFGTPGATYTPTSTREPTATPTAIRPGTATRTLTPAATRTPVPTGKPCTADCDGNRRVRINELSTAVRIALQLSPVARCRAADTSPEDGRVVVNELVEGVGYALRGCPPAPETPGADVIGSTARTCFLTDC